MDKYRSRQMFTTRIEINKIGQLARAKTARQDDFEQKEAKYSILRETGRLAGRCTLIVVSLVDPRHRLAGTLETRPRRGR